MKERLTCERNCLCPYSEQTVGPRPKWDGEPSSLTTDLQAEGVERGRKQAGRKEAEAADKTAKEDVQLKQTEGKTFRVKNMEGETKQPGRGCRIKDISRVSQYAGCWGTKKCFIHLLVKPQALTEYLPSQSFLALQRWAMVSAEVSPFTELRNLTGSVKWAATDEREKLLRSSGLNHHIHFSHMNVGHCGFDDQGVVFQLQGPLRGLKLRLCCL